MELKTGLKHEFFILYIIAFYLFYVCIIQRDANIIFFSLVILGVAGIIYWQRLTRKNLRGNDVDKFFEDIQTQLSVEYEIPSKKTFSIHKTPTNIKYLMKKDDYVKVVYDLKFMKLYDKALYYKLITYINDFLKIHYKVMLMKYDYHLNFQILKDLRHEILNIMKSMHLNIPSISKILAIPDIDKFIIDRTKLLQGLTYKYLKIMYHKFTKEKTYSNYQAPFEYDYAKEANYELF